MRGTVKTVRALLYNGMVTADLHRRGVEIFMQIRVDYVDAHILGRATPLRVHVGAAM